MRDPATFASKGVRKLPERPTRRHPAPTGPDQATVLLVLKRALRWTEHGLVSCCEVCGEPVFGGRSFDWSIHHCRPRDGRRTDNTPANLILCHGASNVDGCHGRIHQNGTWAEALGLKVSRHDPRAADEIPRCIWGESQWTYFTVVGGYSDNPPMEGAS